MNKLLYFLFQLFFKSLRVEMANAVKDTIVGSVVNYKHIYLYTHDNKVKGYLDLGAWKYTITPIKDKNGLLKNNEHLTSNGKYIVYAFFYS